MTRCFRILMLMIFSLALVACGSEEGDGGSDTDDPGDMSGDSAPGDTDPGDGSEDGTGDTDPGDTDPGDTAEDGTEDTDPGDTDPGDTEPDLPPDDKVAMFVAQGHVGRTMISCDDGQTWVANRSFDLEGSPEVCGMQGAITCYEEGSACSFMDGDMCETQDSNCDCNHHPGAAQGVVYGDGYFVATWGWGPPGSVRRSANGVDWEVVLEDTRYGGIGFGNGWFVTGDRNPKVSNDGGATWQDGGQADLQAPNGETVWNVRRFGFADVGEDGVFVVTGESGDNRDILLSDDSGASWFRSETLPAACSAGARGVTGGNGVIVITHGSGDVCYSSDGGTTFAVANVGGSIDTNVVYDGTQFVTYDNGVQYTSTTGETWTSTELTPGNLQLGQVARNPETGTWVGTRGGWQNWYDEQRFYRSTDGVTWTELDAGDYVGSHVINSIAFGYGDPSAECPAE